MAIALAAATAALGLRAGGWLDRLEGMSFDARERLVRTHARAHPDVALVLIDEATLTALDPLVGRWPWPRAVFAEALDFIALGHPKAVVFDVLFTETERGRGGSAGDRRLVQATRQAGVVYHAAHLLRDNDDERNQRLLNRPLPGPFVQRFAVAPAHTAPRNNNYYLPFDGLWQAARGIGVVEFQSDSDGVYRRTRLLRDYGPHMYPSLALVAAQAALAPAKLEVARDGLRLAGRSIPLDTEGRYLLHHYGEFKTYSMSGVLAAAQSVAQGDVDSLLVHPEEFQGKVVLIGASAAGVEDLKATPLAAATPGVMLHAAILSNILQQDFLRTAPALIGAGAGVLLAFVVSGAIVLLRRMRFKLLSAALALGGYVALALAAHAANFVMPVVMPLLAGGLAALGALTYFALSEGRDKRRVRHMLGQYVSPVVLNTVLDRYEDFLRAEVGSRVQLTIMFADIRGFTALSERLPPEEVVRLLNRYFAAMADAIFAAKGTLDKFIGDAIMAFWNAPVPIAHHADAALGAAFDMRRRLAALNAELRAENLTPLEIGIGIHTGEAILGNIGSEKKLDYTAIGDNVNLASRLEGLTKHYESPIIISGETLAALRHAPPCAPIDHVRVKGRVAPVALWQPLVDLGTATPADVAGAEVEAARAAGAFDHYRRRRFNEALAMYRALPARYANRVLLQRCETLAQEPPGEEWSGVFVLSSK